MRRIRRLALLVLLLLPSLAFVPSDVTANEAATAPDITLRDVDGITHRLSQYRGKWVVLEWTNVDCPSVKALYQARGVRALQDAYRPRGLVWLTIDAGSSGTRTAAQTKSAVAALGGSPNAVLLDPTGGASKAFQAQVTPEVRLIAPKGQIVYAGAVQGPAREPHLATVLEAVAASKPAPFASKPARGTRIASGTAAAAPAQTFSGPKAPEFQLIDTNGFAHKLSDYKGKWVILEWVNYDCPFVKKQYHSSHRSMQLLQQRAARYGIVWLSICSSAPGKEGALSSAQANARMRSWGAKPTAYLHDPRGQVGRAFRAAKTPDMRIISPQGTIEYSGGIDSITSMRAADAPRAKNYVRLAIADIVNQRPIQIRSSKAYGCSVKY